MEPVVSTVAELFHQVHQSLRDEVVGLDAEALNWTPGADTNSIAALGQRDRDAEFRAKAETADDLLQQLEQGDAYLDQLAAQISADDLTAVRERGEREPQTGLYWLVSNYGHAREHLAHIQLTKQLYQQRTNT